MISLFRPILSKFPFSAENLYFLSKLPDPYFSEATTNSSAILPRYNVTSYMMTDMYFIPLANELGARPSSPHYSIWRISVQRLSIRDSLMIIWKVCATKHMNFYVYRSSKTLKRLFKNIYLSGACYHSMMDLKEVVTRLNGFAPLHLAQNWDNVGLLVEPSHPHSVKSILLTNDLTEKVAQEAIDKDVNMVISYHPPIFVPLKRLTSSKFKERIIVKMIENRIAVYSPHTAFDAVKNGVNDWLASGLGYAKVEPLQYSKASSSGTSQYKLVTRVLTNQEPERAIRLQDSLRGVGGVERIECETITRLERMCLEF